MTKKQDQDILALKEARSALLRSTSVKMLYANIEFLVDYFIHHPSKELPKKLAAHPKEQE